jgi:hypothetical protein
VERYTSIRDILLIAAVMKWKGTPDGCEDRFYKRCNRRGSVCGEAIRFQDT